MHITSLQNARVKEVVRLRKRSARDETGLFLVEGAREVGRALEAGWRGAAVYFCPAHCGPAEEAVLAQARAAGLPVVECAAEVFAKMSVKEGAEGVLAVLEQTHRTLEDLVLPPNPLLLVAEAIEKPGNLGSILRSADGAGVDAVVLCDGGTDLFNPSTVRNSMGSLFSVPVAEATSAEAQAFLSARHLRTLAATPRGDTLYTEADMTCGLAILLGTESEGLSPLWMNAADVRAHIPMRGRADSLNVACATTLLLYEAVRQRGLANPSTLR